MVLGMVDERTIPVCRICGRECGTIYLNGMNEPCGCENCVSTRDAFDWALDEFEKGRPE